MKYIIFYTTAVCLFLFNTGCEHENRIVVNEGNNHLEISYQGDIQFTDDETSIESMSPDAYLEFRDNHKKLYARNNYHGEIEYRLYDDGRKIDPEDPEGEILLRDAIKKMIDIGFNAEGRMQHIYEKGGAPALLEATVKVPGDFLKGRYLSYLFAHGDPDRDDLIGAAQITAMVMESDFEKSQVLKAFPPDQLHDSLVSAAWFEAARTIRSDFEKAGTLKMFLELPVNDQQFSEILVTTGSINAAFEQTNLLKELIRINMPSSPGSFEKLMAAVRKIDADFEKANLLKAIAEKDINTEVQWSGIIHETKMVNADFERAGVLLLIAQKMPRTDQLNKAYMDAAKTIQSEMEYGRVVKAIQ
ncbi:MAG: hypothetical protein KF746_23990 [Chitinophagaceae bacterium]|nr:hypothetical protein [Chitinophagaceae bacterium]